MTEKETITSLLESAKKERSFLAAFEALGSIIEDQKRALLLKDLRIEELEKELTKVKGGRNGC